MVKACLKQNLAQMKLLPVCLTSITAIITEQTAVANSDVDLQVTAPILCRATDCPEKFHAFPLSEGKCREMTPQPPPSQALSYSPLMLIS
jgi:hypothetical protein